MTQQQYHFKCPNELIMSMIVSYLIASDKFKIHPLYETIIVISKMFSILENSEHQNRLFVDVIEIFFPNHKIEEHEIFDLTIQLIILAYDKNKNLALYLKYLNGKEISHFDMSYEYLLDIKKPYTDEDKIIHEKLTSLLIKQMLYKSVLGKIQMLNSLYFVSNSKKITLFNDFSKKLNLIKNNKKFNYWKDLYNGYHKNPLMLFDLTEYNYALYNKSKKVLEEFEAEIGGQRMRLRIQTPVFKRSYLWF